MIKKYQKFLEAKRKEEYILTLKLKDLDVDYEFHKKISPDIDETEKAWEEYDAYQHFPIIDGKITDEYEIKHGKYIKMLYKLKMNISSYVNEVLKSNNLKCDMYLFNVSSDFDDVLYAMFFVGSKSDLEKINKYYGIEEDKNIRIFTKDDELFDSSEWNSIIEK